MSAILCPGCSAPLRLASAVCESCGRPWSEDEIERARAALVEAHLRRKRLPVVIVAWVLVAACAAGIYYRREIVLGLLAGVKADFVHEMNAQSKRDPGKPLSPMAQQLIGALRVPRGENQTVVTVAADRPAPLIKAPPRAARRPPEPQAPPPHWGALTRVYGVVYDMNTASPVAGAAIVFRASGGMVWSTSTDPDGFYVTDLPTNLVNKGGVEATVTATGYREGQIEDVDPPYFERTEEQRLDALSQLSPSDLESFPVRARPSAILLPLDVVLVPLAR